MNDNVVSYTGSVDNAESYFNHVFAEKYCNVNILGEGLNTYVPNAKDHELTGMLYDEIIESEVAAKLRSSANMLT